MSKLIGTNPNQVPSNADLGTAAFIDKKEFLLSKGSEMSAINAVISKTASDVFIYDTTKDSDGGAWRKRTQHTSWYNERLNTTTRGSRKEFPVVAVIVVRNGDTTIYDGDDPTLPMWMVFDSTDYSMLSNTHNGVTGATMKNGNLVVISVSGYNHGGVSVINFISDYAYLKTSGYTKEHGMGIVNRDRPFYGKAGSSYIVNNNVRDVAITVLPNAPIDVDTELPVPTIAIATDAGVSVIKDDGTVVNITVNNASYTYARRVNFLSDNSLGMGIGVTSGVAQESYYIFNTIPSSNNVITVDNIAGTIQNVDEFYAIQYPNSIVDLQLLGLDTNRALYSSTGNSFGADKGLSIVNRNVGAPDKGMVAYVASDYNTGYQVGDIKLATLSDTDPGYISASNNTNLLSGQWTNNGSFPYETFTSSGLDITSAINTTAYGAANKTWTATPGKTYTAYFNLTLNSGTAPTLYVQTSSSFGNGVSYQTVNGVNAFTFTATMSTSSYFSFSVANGVASNFSVSNLELYEGGVADRSVNNPSSGLSVFGTVTKTPVAPGAELMGYSGFSSSNYLRQAYNTNLNFGTGSYSVMGWFKTASTTALGMVTQHGPSDADENLCVYISPSNYGIYFDYGAGGEYCYLSQSADRSTIANTEWHHFVCHVSAGGPPKIYVDGISRDLTISANGPSTFRFDTDYVLNVGIGRGTDNDIPFDGSISLLRISGTEPTPEQIEKIYNDEKALFQENAKATLYGTSDAVPALAYDDDTGLLHAGTSAGRSDFQGLRRINNTTRAIGTAISAVDGFIVEE